MVANDWKEILLGDVLTLQRGFDLPHKKRQSGNVPVVSSCGISDKHFEAKVSSPGVVTGRYGTIGQVFFINEDFWPLNTTLFVKEFNGNDPLFLSFLLSRIDFKTYSDKSGVPGVNRNDLHQIVVTLPPPPEQTAIAAALSDVDALIASLDRLIAKKRDIKQATMQQLLTGKTRLPGFSDEWKVKKVGEILRVRHGKSQHGVAVNDGKYPVLATGGEIGRTNDYIYDKPSVLIGRKGTIDSPQYMDIPFWTIDTLFYTEISDCVHPRFVFYLFNMVDWLRYNEASGVPSLNASTIENIEIQCPLFLEQQAITNILSDIDAEIAALEQKRDKIRALKQGMMQELLTGKTRLV